MVGLFSVFFFILGVILCFFIRLKTDDKLALLAIVGIIAVTVVFYYQVIYSPPTHYLDRKYGAWPAGKFNYSEPDTISPQFQIRYLPEDRIEWNGHRINLTANDLPSIAGARIVYNGSICPNGTEYVVRPSPVGKCVSEYSNGTPTGYGHCTISDDLVQHFFCLKVCADNITTNCVSPLNLSWYHSSIRETHGSG